MTRKELVQKDDITSGLERVTNYVVEHGKPIAIGVAVVVVGIAIVVVLNVNAANREAAAQNALAEVIRIYSTVTEDTTDESRFQATLVEAARVEADHPDQPAAQIARYYTGLSHEGLGDYDQAIAILSELSDSGDEMVSPVARFALAESYKKQDNLERAIEVYQELADSAGYSQSAVLYELGRLYEATSMPGEARDYYQSVVGDYPDSPYRADADRALRRLELTDNADEEPS
jgi:tetratricopeptide (TPR) repeat protein